MYYKVCSDCGSHLDPGERCDCQVSHRPSWSEAVAKAPVNYFEQNPKPGILSSNISIHKPAKFTSRTLFCQSSFKSKI